MRFSASELRRFLDFVGGAYAADSLDAFARHVVHGLSTVVPVDSASYNEINEPRQRVRYIVEPAAIVDFPNAAQIFERYFHENPLLPHYLRTRDTRPLKISDFITQAQFQRTTLYNEFYRHLPLKYLMAVAFPAPRPLSIAVSWNRVRRDFTEQERALVNLLGPHVIRAYRNVEIVTELRRELDLFRQGADHLGHAFIALEADGRVRSATAKARRLLRRYFADRPRSGRLPGLLMQWVAEQQRRLEAADMGPPPALLIVTTGDRRLVIRLFARPPAAAESARPFIIMKEERTGAAPDAITSLGLSRRETEVLAWVAEGKTNPEIAIILGLSPRTIQHHLDHVYRKLGVETRTAAAALALDVIRTSG